MGCRFIASLDRLLEKGVDYQERIPNLPWWFILAGWVWIAFWLGIPFLLGAAHA